MISFIKGQAVVINESNIILENNGIGYSIFMSSRDIANLYKNEEIKLYTYMQVKEDALALFGFLDYKDLELFTLLIGVPGVGPKTAIGFFSTYDAIYIRKLIVSDDDKNLSKVPGIGKKTAKKIILELKDKISISSGSDIESDVSTINIDEDKKNDVMLALISLGYNKSDALNAISTIDHDMDIEDMIKASLKALSSI